MVKRARRQRKAQKESQQKFQVEHNKIEEIKGGLTNFAALKS
jgi:hypothetical protein